MGARMIAVVLGISLLATAAQASPRSRARMIINERREAKGCDRLTSAGPHLTASARKHSRVMARAGHIFHSTLDADGWSIVGEVVGVAAKWRAVITALFQSPPHRHLLLDCRFDRIALGFFFSRSVWLTGRLYAL
jgi:uncharacterized protein YkwD